METLMQNFIAKIPEGCTGTLILIATIAVSLVVLAKGADLLVDEAVALSVRWGVPKIVIGATIVSLGTTLPEVSVSVASAIKGAAGLALGNAVGSIICDTGLILGLAALIRPLPFERKSVNFQNWIQILSASLLVGICCAFSGAEGFSKGGRLPQGAGFLFLALLAAYIVFSIKNSKSAGKDEPLSEQNGENIAAIFAKTVAGIALVVGSSQVLIPSAQETAIRAGISESVIAATLVAFGTSLPELVTGITSARKGHGDLAIGNVVGADILNVLFVTGASLAVTKGGLFVDARFFRLLFPAMIFILAVFKAAVLFSREKISRAFGAVLLFSYIAVTILTYVF